MQFLVQRGRERWACGSTVALLLTCHPQTSQPVMTSLEFQHHRWRSRLMNQYFKWKSSVPAVRLKKLFYVSSLGQCAIWAHGEVEFFGSRYLWNWQVRTNLTHQNAGIMPQFFVIENKIIIFTPFVFPGLKSKFTPPGFSLNFYLF